MTIRSALFGIIVAASAFALDIALVRRVVGPVPIADPGTGGSVLLPVLVAAVVIAVAAAPIDADRARSWLEQRSLPTTDELVAATQAWLRRTRTARGLGFGVFFVSGTAPAWLINVSGLQPGDPTRDHLLDLVGSWPIDQWAAPIVGYALGAIVAELTRRPSDAASGTRVADLRPRPLAGYLQPLSRWGPRLLAAAAIATAAVTAISGATPSQGPGSASLAQWSLLVLAVNEAILRGVVRRPQTATDQAAIAFDDAARATTVHAVAGSAIGVLGSLLGDHLNGLTLANDGTVRLAISLFAFAITIGSFGVWLGHGVGLAHRVRRTQRTSVPS